MNENYLNLKNKKVIISAGASGIGLAIVEYLYNQGCDIGICDINEEKLKQVKHSFPNVTTFKADASCENDIQKFMSFILADFSHVDVLINNAGIAGPTGAIEDIDYNEWKSCLDVCLSSQFLLAKYAVPSMKKNGGGSIINMSSAAGKHGYAYRTPYSSAKFGVIGLTQSLAKELGASNIRVNAILPGIVEGDRMTNVIKERAKKLNISYDEMLSIYLENVSLRKMVSPNDIAQMVAFLISDLGKHISGQSIAVDGNVVNL